MPEHTPIELDARGLMCPEPVTLAQARIAVMLSDQCLVVLTSDPAAPIDFEAWCLQRGHAWLGCEATAWGHRITLARASEG
jgi:tRNA 2-thiouridine synthesizing protein A